MPPEIQAQEKDIEWLFRRLLRNYSRDTQRQTADAREHEGAVWILIVVEALIGLIAFYFLYLKAGE